MRKKNRKRRREKSVRPNTFQLISADRRRPSSPPDAALVSAAVKRGARTKRFRIPQKNILRALELVLGN